MFLLAAVLAGCKPEKPAERKTYPFRRFLVERGHLKYKYSGDFRGVEDVYFDRWGMREARIANFEELTDAEIKPNKDHKVTLGAVIYQFDPIRKVGIVKDDRLMDSLMHLEPKDQPPAETYSRELLIRMDHKPVAIDTVLGLPAQRWETVRGGPMLWEWKGILMKRVVPGRKSVQILTAVELDTAWAVDSSVFAVPREVKFTPAPTPKP